MQQIWVQQKKIQLDCTYAPRKIRSHNFWTSPVYLDKIHSIHWCFRSLHWSSNRHGRNVRNVYPPTNSQVQSCSQCYIWSVHMYVCKCTWNYVIFLIIMPLSRLPSSRSGVFVVLRISSVMDGKNLVMFHMILSWSQLQTEKKSKLVEVYFLLTFAQCR